MKELAGQIRLSATDLAGHLGCRHLTELDLAAARGEIKPPTWRDEALEILQLRGLEHETSYIEHLRASGLTVVELSSEDSVDLAFERTCGAMRSGADAIVQATLKSGRWLGRADILRRVDRSSNLGEWSYEVVDTKLAKETRAGTILQLCLYSDIVSTIQGTLPERMYVVSPGSGFEPEEFRVHDFLAYYRLVRSRLERFTDDADGDRTTYPDPVPQCDICRWWSVCAGRRRDDDHLSLVAGISRLQRRELESWDIDTLERLANLRLPLERRPRRGAPEGYERVREQARVQRDGRQRKAPVHELLPLEPEKGLARLPEPSPGDIFFDVEGDAFVGQEGLEYLLGWSTVGDDGAPEYTGLWALRPEDERSAFEKFVDYVVERRSRFPDLHIYHYTSYDPGALKRLMGRYASKEEEIDSLLRAGVFVDLHAVVKQSVRASVERYSIKDLEPFYRFERAIPLVDASLRIRALERALELGEETDLDQEIRAAVEGYNRDDCISTRRLRDWLEELRSDAIARGGAIDRPLPRSGDPSDTVEERSQRVEELLRALLDGVPEERDDRDASQHARWLLAHLLEWHRREDKAPWWEYYRLLDLTDEELRDEKAALVGLEHLDRIGGTKRCPIDRYRYPKQDSDLRKGDSLHTTVRRGEALPTSDAARLGEVDAIDPAQRTVDIKKAGEFADVHPGSVFAHTIIRAAVLTESLLRLADWVVAHGVDADGPCRSARDLLLSRPPRLRKDAELRRDGEDTVEAARRLAVALDGGVLPVQGPPGSGKTHAGARMILDLVRAGKRVGITAVSHKVIRHLLEEVVSAAGEEGLSVSCVQKVKGKARKDVPCIREVTDNAKVVKALDDGEAQVAAGTAWLWARPDLAEAVDVLFVDEAGQMSLANVLAVAQAGKSLVLLGDPRQLEQPQRGTHPEGTDVSALEHLLGGRKTLADDRGLFLAETWRLHPAICAFTSELFYENRLRSRPGLERQALAGPTRWNGSGLWFVPVEHEGNQNSSLEEVDRVAEIVDELTAGGSTWVDGDGCARPVDLDDILIVAPYNAQVTDLSERLPGARVGTVDRFQGQQAPVVIYSMTTSSPEEAPRGMEFLYSLSRLNVATSRARCACILVASPRLFEPECQSPGQMRLANAFCRYLERSTTTLLA